MLRIAMRIVRRLWLPLVLLATFLGIGVAVSMRLEKLRAIDAPFWIIHNHAMDYGVVHSSTKIIALFVYAGVFAFQIWIAQRVLLTIFSHQGVEAWKSMVNEVNVDRLRDISSSAVMARSAVT
jgi:hypothetical protein